MGRRQKKSRRAKSAPLKAAAGTQPAESSSKRRYLRSKVLDYKDRPDKADDARQMLDRLWPDEASRPARIAWLIVNWPDQARRELEEHPADDAVRTALAGAAMFAAADDVSSMGARHGLDAGFHAELKDVQDALAKLLAGDDDGFEEVIQGIGLRSPFRDAKLFLKGLAAAYAGDDENATRAFDKLAGSSSALRGPAVRMQSMLEEGGASRRVVTELANLSAAGKADGAVRTLGKNLSRLDRAIADAAVRGLAVALSASQDPDRVIAMLRRNNIGIEDDPKLDRLHAGTLLPFGWVEEKPWASYADELARNPQWFGADHDIATAAVAVQVGDAVMVAYDDREDYGESVRGLAERAAESFERAHRCDPGVMSHWCKHFETLLLTDDVSGAPALGDAFVAAFPDSSHPWTHIAEFWIGQKEYANADLALERGLRLHPDDPVLTEKRAPLLIRGLTSLMERDAPAGDVDKQLRVLRGLQPLSREMRLNILGLEAAVALTWSSAHRPKSLRTLAALIGEGNAVGGAPWLFVGLVIMNATWWRAELPAGDVEPLLPESGPTADDFTELCDLASNPQIREHSGGPMTELILCAAGLLQDELDASGYFRAMSLMPPDAAVEFALKGLPKWIDDRFFGLPFYWLAVDTGAVPDVFAGWRERLDAWSREEPSLREELLDLAEEIEAHLEDHTTPGIDDVLGDSDDDSDQRELPF